MTAGFSRKAEIVEHGDPRPHAAALISRYGEHPEHVEKSLPGGRAGIDQLLGGTKFVSYSLMTGQTNDPQPFATNRHGSTPLLGTR